MITSLILLPLRVCTDRCACADNDYELKPTTLEGMHRHVCADNDYGLKPTTLEGMHRHACTDTCMCVDTTQHSTDATQHSTMSLCAAQ